MTCKRISTGVWRATKAMGVCSKNAYLKGLLLVVCCLCFSDLYLRYFNEQVSAIATDLQVKNEDLFHIKKDVQLISGIIVTDKADLKTKSNELRNTKSPEVEELLNRCLYTYLRYNIKEEEELLDQDPSSVDEAERIFNKSFEVVGAKCDRFMYFGKWNNNCASLWPVCMDENVVPKPPCITYSFGIDFDFSFDDLMGSKGCEVHSFDPSMNIASHRRSDQVMFHAVGLGDKNDDLFSPNLDVYVHKKTSWKIRTLASIMSELGHSQAIIDVIKLDIEGYEWAVFEEIFKSDILSRVRHLLVEWHVFRHGRNNLIAYTRILRRLIQNKFRKYFSHKIVYFRRGCPYGYCNQVNAAYLNTNLIRL